jgi:hypothetical protein
LPISDCQLPIDALVASHQESIGSFALYGERPIGNWQSAIGNVLAREVLKREPARHGMHKMLTVPPPPTSPERRLPLRQLPSERPFSASPQYADPVRNGWVFPHS